VNRVLDPNEGNVTIETLQKAAPMVGRRVQLELVQAAQLRSLGALSLQPVNPVAHNLSALG